MRVLITGAGGFLGRTLATKLHMQHETVAALVRREPDLPGDIERRFVDIRDRAALTATVEQWSPDAIVHLAALKSIRDSQGNEGDCRATNVDGTTALISALKHADPYTHVVFASTVSIYGPQGDPDEGSPTDPRNPYAQSKLEAEQTLLAAAKTGACRTTILRLANIAGGFREIYDRDDKPIIPRVLTSARDGQPVPVNGAGDSVRDYVHVEDAADAVIAALQTGPSSPSALFNVGSGQGASVTEIITVAEQITGNPIAVERKPPVEEVERVVPNVQRIQQELGWSPYRSSLARIITDGWEAMTTTLPDA
ncbi:NAD-dependent epimerase/dehydratase family protein [Saccharomonospora sp. NPDC046836]|uniref:NAD-dependent epimerase/dehydratase family protein n=1 Tax=Saccharomonospora sp. NPDC046836 TaxID=3156921 RepID=UPI0033DCB8A1